MFDRYSLMIANMTYLAMPMSNIPVHVCETSLQGAAAEGERIQHQLALRDGPVVCVERMQPGDADVPLEHLVIERALSINTAAAAGNASLMSIG
ncbi:Bifunctional protein PutA [compost metagenome]